VSIRSYWFLAVFLPALPAIGLAQAGSPAGAVPVANLGARREALIGRIKSGVAVIRGAEELADDPPASQYPRPAPSARTTISST
jgi:hypothetical protein